MLVPLKYNTSPVQHVGGNLLRSQSITTLYAVSQSIPRMTSNSDMSMILKSTVSRVPKISNSQPRHGVGGRSLRLEDLVPLLIWQGVRGVLRPQKSKVYFHATGPQYEATQMDGVPRGL